MTADSEIPRFEVRVVRAALLACLFWFAGPGGWAVSQKRAECLECHSDASITGARGGKEISMYVNEKDLDASVHRNMECVTCHRDLSGSEFPHKEDVKPVNCGVCHSKALSDYTRTIHGQVAAKGDALAPRCWNCHGSHRILRRGDPTSPTATINVPQTCGNCHHEGSPVSQAYDIPQERILENYSESIHGVGLYKMGLTVTAVCTSCHEAHRILPSADPESSVNRKNVAKTCTKCHSRIEDVHRKVIHGKLWEQEAHKIPACSECHSPHKVRKPSGPDGMANADCLACHGKKDLAAVRGGKRVSMYVDAQAYASSSHARTACAQCHTDVTTSRVRPCESAKGRVECAVCHAEQVSAYRNSVHGKFAAKGDKAAPVCLDCHDYHATKGKRLPSSPTYPRNVPELCARCHRAGQKAAVRIVSDVPDIIKSYQMSIHGVGLIQSGLVVTATCVDCHTSHGELPPSDPKSTVHPSRIVDTCGRCHRGILEVFQASVHGGQAAKPGKKLPNCEDCHSSHSIRRTDQPGFRIQMMNQCGRCHKPEAETFFTTYHGKVTQLGSVGAAKCYDCHGTHDILPPANRYSRLSRQNVVSTCGACHPGAHRRFAGYLTHATHHDRNKYPWLFYAFWGMTTLLVGTLTFATVHTLAWLWRLWRSRDLWRARKASYGGAGEKLYRRFNTFQRGLHITMMLSFFALAVTGMSLKFSYMAWAQVFSNSLGGFNSMGGLHRFAALVLVAVFLIHLWDLRRQKRDSGLSWFRFVTQPDSLLFNKNDLLEFFGAVKWFFGKGPRPRFGRYTYWEKFDYFSVFWGVFIIGSTGMVLWFPEFFTYFMPGEAINVATIVHSDEALLAVAFIFTVHFFNTHFRPDKFPMDPVIFTGRVPVEELKHDKPREYEELVAAGKLEEHIVEPYHPKVERAFRAYGFVALGVGLLLIGLIVYSMLFGYR